ncbi:MAG: tail fiber domain-containing protein [Pseudomonadota bacterium]
MTTLFPRAAARSLALAVALSPTAALATGFVYEGRLDDGGAPANGRYDLRLSPFADAKSGAALAAPIVFEDVPVVDGRFRIDYDLPLATASTAWIEVGLRDGRAGGACSTIPGRSEAAAVKAIGACWSSTGDSATNPAVNFLGTTDAQPLVLRVQNQQVARYEPSTVLSNGAPVTANVIAGSSVNALFAGVRGAVIAGGGAPVDGDPGVVAGAPNRVNDHYGTIGGGFGNLAGDQLIDLSSAFAATVGGGSTNAATALFATVAGGRNNVAGEFGTHIGGGESNAATGEAATIAGGRFNRAQANAATVGGGSSNTASGIRSTVAGGRDNVASGASAAIGGGFQNLASLDDAVVAGGRSNTASGLYAAVAGGLGNQATDTWATVAGGSENIASGAASVVGGGGSSGALASSSTVPGGFRNCAGGVSSFAAGSQAKVRRGVSTPATTVSGCANVPATSDLDGDEGTFVWSGSTSDFVSTGPRQFLVNSPNGVAINVNDPAGSTLRVAGTLRVDTLGTSGSTTLCRNASNQISGCSSSARYKEHITDLDLGLAVVERLRPVAYAWKSTHEADIGFVAEEIAAIDPRLVTRDAAGEIEGVKYERLTAVLAVALQESNARHSLALEAAEARHADALALRDAALRRLDARLRALESPASTAPRQ